MSLNRFDDESTAAQPHADSATTVVLPQTDGRSTTVLRPVDGESTAVFPAVNAASINEPAPPIFEPAAKQAAITPQHNTKQTVAIVAAILVAAFILIAGVCASWRQHQIQALEQTCQEQVAQLQNQQNELDQYVKSNKVQQALKVTEEQVDNKQTLQNLQQAVKDAGKHTTAPECSVGFFEFDKKLDVPNDVAVREAAVQRAVDAVNQSITEKQLQDTKTSLQEALDQAQQVLKDSEGKVSDNAVRERLKQAIDAAKKLVDNSKLKDVAALATDTILKAVDAVKQAMEEQVQAG